MPDVLLVHFDGVNGSTAFTDVSPAAHTLTATSAVVSTTSPKFGTGSGDFTANSGARIDTGNASDFNFGAGQFTLEAWAYFTSLPSAIGVILSQYGGGANLGWELLRRANGAYAFDFTQNGTTTSNLTILSPGFVTNTWYHLALDRDAAGRTRIYSNGVVLDSTVFSYTLYASTQTCMIGNDHDLTHAFPGRLDEVRIGAGVARYGGAFTPPAAPFNGSGGGGGGATMRQHAVTIANG